MQQLQPNTIKQLNDGAKFRLSKRSKVIYELISKDDFLPVRDAVINSLSSKRSFVKSWDTAVWV